MLGEWAGTIGWDTPLWAWFGDQGFEYLDLSRCWQVLLTLGLFHLGGHHLPRYSGAAAA